MTKTKTRDYYREIIADCRKMPPVRTAVVHPVQADVLQAVAEAAAEKLIVPVLIGPRSRIIAAAKEAKISLKSWDIIDTEHSHAAAAKAAALAASGKVDAIMKGSLHTDELLNAIVPSDAGLRTARRISHAFVMSVPDYPKPLIVTDAAVNIAPDAAMKADICQNAINLWHVLFGDKNLPKVAILAAVETVNPKMQATVDAAVLCKMADRGQITGAILDGPLAFDNAISKAAAREKGIVSKVAGDADILLVPEIESGNILAKQLSFLGHADAAGIVLGARVPVILSSRADNLRARLMSCACAVKMACAARGKNKMTETILVINAGSSSVKFSLFGKTRALPLIVSGKVEDIGAAPVFCAGGKKEKLPRGSTHEDALRHILRWTEKKKHGDIAIAAHRVVHGGTVFTQPVAVTPAVMKKLRALIPLAPLHQPHNLAAIDILRKLMPKLPQVACFDTAFHAGRDPLFTSYALPQNLADRGIRRYGFHGLSYEWIAHVMRRDHAKLAKGRVVAAHLGNGASLCAMKNGRSVDTTMGMTALEGLPMGTRSGSLDPGAVIYMIRDLKISVSGAEHILYNDSGLKGLSGLTNDVKSLQASRDPKVKFALDYFSLKTAQYIGMMAVALGGMDALVFTGGIGENAAGVRQDILRHLKFLKPFQMLVIPANEEGVIARHALKIL